MLRVDSCGLLSITLFDFGLFYNRARMRSPRALGKWRRINKWQQYCWQNKVFYCMFIRWQQVLVVLWWRSGVVGAITHNHVMSVAVECAMAFWGLLSMELVTSKAVCLRLAGRYFVLERYKTCVCATWPLLPGILRARPCVCVRRARFGFYVESLFLPAYCSNRVR